MYVIDASVWTSRFIPSDENHAESHEWIESVRISRTKVVEPTLILPEIAGAVARRTHDSNLGNEVAASIADMQLLTLTPLEQGAASLTADLAASLMIKGSDAVYLAVAESTGFELVTWDKEQLERGGDRVPVRRPSDLLAERGGV